MLWNDNWHFEPWLWIMMVLMILFWTVVLGGCIWLIAYIIKRYKNNFSIMTTESAVDILNMRYENGEISKDEYDQMKRDIAEP